MKGSTRDVAVVLALAALVVPILHAEDRFEFRSYRDIEAYFKTLGYTYETWREGTRDIPPRLRHGCPAAVAEGQPRGNRDAEEATVLSGPAAPGAEGQRVDLRGANQSIGPHQQMERFIGPLCQGGELARRVGPQVWGCSVQGRGVDCGQVGGTADPRRRHTRVSRLGPGCLRKRLRYIQVCRPGQRPLWVVELGRQGNETGSAEKK